MPKQICKYCGRERSCLSHLRSEFPPDAAKKWLKKTCAEKGNPCDIKYRAGMRPAGQMRGGY